MVRLVLIAMVAIALVIVSRISRSLKLRSIRPLDSRRLSMTHLLHQSYGHLKRVSFSVSAISDSHDNNRNDELLQDNSDTLGGSGTVNAIVSSVRDNLVHTCLLSRNEYVYMLLSVSGGVDSMALLHIMAEIQRNFWPLWRFGVVNFNHKLRPESDEEAEFVRNWAQQYNMDFFERTATQGKLGKHSVAAVGEDSSDELHSTGIQLAARNWRRAELFSIIDELKARDVPAAPTTNRTKYVIATAHHFDDNIETIFMKLFRGVHISKLHGISSYSQQSGYTIVRPLSNLRKEDIISYMKQRDLTWREDSSNSEIKYKRNKFRMEVIPMLEELAGSKEALARRSITLSKQSAQVNELLGKQHLEFIIKNVYVYEPEVRETNSKGVTDTSSESGLDRRNLRWAFIDVVKFVELPSLVQSEVLREVLYERLQIPGQCNADKIEELRSLAFTDLTAGRSRTVPLHKYWQATRLSPDVIRIFHSSQSLEPLVHSNISSIEVYYDKGIDFKLALSKGAATSDIAPLINSIPLVPVASGPLVASSNNRTTSFFRAPVSHTVIIGNVPADSILSIRYPREGDKYAPKNTSINFVSFFRQRQIPQHLRALLPVVTLRTSDGTERIIAAPPHVFRAAAEGGSATSSNVTLVLTARTFL